jgi:hypothetical protein
MSPLNLSGVLVAGDRSFPIMQPQLGAALAYYTVFSLAPMVLVLLAVFWAHLRQQRGRPPRDPSPALFFPRSQHTNLVGTLSMGFGLIIGSHPSGGFGVEGGLGRGSGVGGYGCGGVGAGVGDGGVGCDGSGWGISGTGISSKTFFISSGTVL